MTIHLDNTQLFQLGTIIVSTIALIFSIKRDTRNAKKEELESLKEERNLCMNRLSNLETELNHLKETNLTLMKKALSI